MTNSLSLSSCGLPSLISDQLSKTNALCSFDGSKVLLAEDNIICQTVARKTLEGWSIVVDAVSNGSEAIAKLRNSDCYDLIIMDVQMPEINGLDATKVIRAEFSQRKRIPIIAMTASTLIEDLKETQDAGMDDYIVKPFNNADLRLKLRKFLQEVHKLPAANREIKRLIDFKYLESVSPGNVAFHKEILGIFQEQSRQYFQAIKENFLDKKFDTVRTKAHAFKPMGSYVGIDRLTTLLRELETAAVDENITTMLILINDIGNIVTQANAEINELYKL